MGQLGMLLTQSGTPIIGQISWIMGKLLDGIYKLGIHNIGICIIILTIIVYTLMFPLTLKQQKFQIISNKMQPELIAIQKKYKGKKDQASMAKMQDETRALYEKYGTSQLGGCSSAFIQLPLLYAFYNVIRGIPAYITTIKNVYINSGLIDSIINSNNGVHKKFAKLALEKPVLENVNFNQSKEVVQNKIIDSFWKFQSTHWNKLEKIVNNSSSKIDKIVEQINKSTHFLCYNIIETPAIMFSYSWKSKNFVDMGMALLIPILAGLTQWISVKLMPQPQQDPDSQLGNSMKMMTTFMPLFSVFITFSVPIGLGIYWIISAVIRTIQQIIINKHLDKVGVDAIVSKNLEKQAKKRERKGIPSGQKLNEKASISTRTINKNDNNKIDNNSEKDSSSTYNKKAKPGSLASRANMVKDFNEKNKKK